MRHVRKACSLCIVLCSVLAFVSVNVLLSVDSTAVPFRPIVLPVDPPSPDLGACHESTDATLPAIEDCDVIFSPVDFNRQQSSGHRTSFVVLSDPLSDATQGSPALNDLLNCWSRADVDGVNIVLSVAPTVPVSSNASAWTAAYATPTKCGLVSKDFPGMTSATPGLLAALSFGDTTIAVVQHADNCIPYAGLIFPTSETSMLPIIPRDQFDDSLTRGRGRQEMLLDVSCPDPPRVEAATCQVPEAPRVMSEEPWQGGFTQENGWIDLNGIQVSAADVVGRHFITDARKARKSSLTLCSVPVVAAVQYGMCETTGLDDQATPLVLPLGEAPPAVLTAPGVDAVPVTYGGMAVHSSLAWALLPAVEPGLGQGVTVLIQAVLALYGHAAVILPPGRLCGMHTGMRPNVSTDSSAGTVDQRALAGLVSQLAADLVAAGLPAQLPPTMHLRDGPGSNRQPPGIPALNEHGLPLLKRASATASVRSLLGLAVESRTIVEAGRLTPRDCEAMRQWLRILDGAGFAYPPIQPTYAEYIRVAQRAVETNFAASNRNMFGPDAGAELTHLHVSSHILLIVAAQTSASEVDARRSAWKSVLSAAIKADASGSPTTILPRLAVRARLRPMVTLTACAGRTQHKGSAGTGLWDQGPRSTALTVPLPALKGARSYLRHCVADGAHVRDVVKVTIFRHWDPKQSQESLGTLLRLYAPAFPLLVTTEPYITSTVWNADSCVTSAVSAQGSDSEAAYQCIGSVLSSAPGHLGFLVTFSDTIVLPWKLLQHRTDRPLVFSEQPGSMCENTAATSASLLRNATLKLPVRFQDMLAPHDAVREEANVSCNRMGAFYVPGAIARDATQLISAMRSQGLGFDAAMHFLLGIFEHDPKVIHQPALYRQGPPAQPWVHNWAQSDCAALSPFDVGIRQHAHLAMREFEVAYASAQDLAS